MATTTTTTTLLESLSEKHHEYNFIPPRSRRSSSRRSSGGSEGSRSSISSTMSYSSSMSTESCASGDGIVKGLTILGVCLVYAFVLFFIASVTTALSYIFKFGTKGAKKTVKCSVVSRSTQLTKGKLNVKLPVHKQG